MSKDAPGRRPDDDRTRPEAPIPEGVRDRPVVRADGGIAGPRRPGLTRLHVALIVAGMMLGFSVAPLYQVARDDPSNKDYDLWQQTGRIVLDGRDIYPRTQQLFPFMYPPACATMLAPLSVLPRGAFVAALLTLNSASWTACILLSVYLATGRFRGNRPELYLLPSLAVIPFVHDTYLLGQPALLLLALLLGAFACLRRARPGWAGALLATATAIKAFPLLAAGYLVYRRQWRATAAMGLTLVGLMFVAPLAFRAPSRVGEDFVLWARGMLFKYDEGAIAQRPYRSYSYKNQSIQATVHRLARPVLADGEADRSWRVNLLSLDFRQTTLLMLGSVAALGVYYLWSTRGARGQAEPADAAEQAMATLLLVMFSPLSFNYMYVWMMFPLAVLLHLAASAPGGSAIRRTALGLVAASVTLLALAIPMRRVAQAYGSVFFSGLVLLIGLGWILRRNWIAQALPSTSGSRHAPSPLRAGGRTAASS